MTGSRQIIGVLIIVVAALGCKTIIEVNDWPADGGDQNSDGGGVPEPVVCGGEVCDGPSSTCEDSQTLFVWDGAPGRCTDGRCSYVMVRWACATRCVMGACMLVDDDTGGDSDTMGGESG